MRPALPRAGLIATDVPNRRLLDEAKCLEPATVSAGLHHGQKLRSQGGRDEETCALVAATVLVLAVVATPVVADDFAVEGESICHRTGNGSFVVINVPNDSLPDHGAHGDLDWDEDLEACVVP
jgi:hypothetical protein